jgi:tetratricopeptide (TPR) repeat protein
MGRANDEKYKTYDDMHVRALEASLDGDYSTSLDLFKQLIEQFPTEGAPYIRTADLIYKGAEKLSSAEKIFNVISMLDKAENLIKGGSSKYPMDKYDGLRDLYFLRGYFYHILAGAMPEYANKAQADFDRCLELDPDYEKAINYKESSRQEQSQKKQSPKSGGCFIATAACGSEFAPEVIILRNFRDNHLTISLIGRLAIKFYYMVSPRIASFIDRSPIRRNLVRQLMISPIARWIKTNIM